jgi:hypothetical protein
MAITYSGQTRSTLTDSSSPTPQIRYVDDVIVNVAPQDIPMQKLIGLNGFTATNPKIEWEEDGYLPTSATLQAAVTTTGTTSISVATGTGAYFQQGNVLRFNDGTNTEYMWVQAVSGDTLTVTRAYDGGTAFTWTVSGPVTTIEIIGIAAIENADSPSKGTTVIDFPFNYMQLFDTAFQVSMTRNNTSLYGEGSDYDYQMTKTLKELQIKLEKAIFYGQRVAGSGNTKPYGTGGLNYFITTNVTAAGGGYLTEKLLLDSLQLIFNSVGKANMGNMVIVSNMFQKRRINEFYRNVGAGATSAATPFSNQGARTSFNASDSTAGVVLETLETDVGRVKMLMHYFCPKDTVYILNLDNIKLGPYKGMRFHTADLPAAGPYKKGRVTGQYGLMVKAQLTHALISGLATS